MQPQVYDAIKRAYIDSRGYEDRNYRLVSEEIVKQIVREMTETCNLNVAVEWGNGSFTTSYELEITRAGIPTGAQRVADPTLEQLLPESYWRLFVRISWLGPLALRFWNAYDRDQQPRYYDKPETQEDLDVEKCAVGVLSRHGIRMLTNEELDELFPIPGLILEDDATHNVRHLLFSEII